MPNFTAGTSFTDGVTNDVTAAKLNALVADAVPTSSLALTSTNGTIANFTASTANITLGTIPTLTAGTTTGTAGIFTSGTIATLNSTTGTIPTLVATTLITTGTGTAAAPAVAPTGDTNTGIFFPAADTIAFSEGGAEAMRIDSSGNVGVGTATPASRLSITTSSATMLSCDSTSTDGGYITISRSGVAKGYVGIASPLIASSSSNDLGIRSDANLVFSSGGNTERLRIDSDGNLLVGGTNTEPAGNSTSGVAVKPAATSANGMVEICNANLTALVLGSTTGDATLARFRRAGAAVGSISVTAGATAFVTSSDYRLKTNLEPISNGIERIKQLPVYRFNWKTNENGNKVDGFVAHEVTPIVREAIHGEKDAVDEDGNPIYQGIDQSKIVPLLTAALKEAIIKIEVLESKVAALEAA